MKSNVIASAIFGMIVVAFGSRYREIRSGLASVRLFGHIFAEVIFTAIVYYCEFALHIII